MNHSRYETIRTNLRKPRVFGLFAIFIALLILPATSAFAADFSVIGAQTLARGQKAAYVTVGLPDAEIGVGIGLNSIADMTPRLRLQYGRGTRIGGAGVGAGAAFRMKIARARAWTFAVLAEPEIALHMWGEDMPPTTTVGVPALSLSPFAVGAVADRVVVPGVRVTAGLKVPVTFYVQPEWVMNVPVIAEVGVESEVARNMLLIARIDSGIDFYGPGGLPGTQPYFRVRVGLGWGQ